MRQSGFDSKESVIRAVKEMLRVTNERIFIAESLPIAKNIHPPL